jgi:hypothetical protein
LPSRAARRSARDAAAEVTREEIDVVQEVPDSGVQVTSELGNDRLNDCISVQIGSSG